MSDAASKAEAGTVSSGLQNGANANADEAELARMGYKQELKCVLFALMAAGVVCSTWVWQT
jgi:hypothetical protein